jgi:hypothetical protein
VVSLVPSPVPNALVPKPVDTRVEKVPSLVPAPKVDGMPVGLNVGTLVGTNGPTFVMRPVGKNEVLANVGNPVTMRVPVCN